MADDFLTTYAPLANDISGQTGLNPATVLGIIDTETGHGQHVLGNNIVGISPPQRISVAQYPDVQTASQAFVGLMRQPNYAPAATVTDPAAQVQLLVRGGYNTVNPKYASTVAANAQNAVKQLGYQDGSSGGGQGGDQTAQASTADYNNNPPSPTSAQPPASTPAPVQPQQGSAKDRVLSDPALSAGGGSTSAPAASAKDRVLADPALRVTTETTSEPPAMTFDEYGTPLINGAPPSVSDVLAAGAKAHAPTKEDVTKFLAPAPNTTYGDILPLAKDNATGAIRLALPNIIRNPLIGLTEGPSTDGTFGSSGVTWNPQTQTYGLTPEAASVGQFAANPLRFSGPNALLREPPSMLTQMGATKPLPVTLPELNAAIARAGPEPSPPAGVPVNAGGGAAGAQVTPALNAGLSPSETAAYQKTAEGQKLMEGQIIGEPDRNQYIPGVTANTAEQEQTVAHARELKALGIAEPKVSDEARLAAQDNAQKRTEYYRDTAQSPVDYDAEARARQTDIEQSKPKVFAPDNVTGPVDHAPIVDTIRQIIEAPENRQNDAVQAVLRPLLERLENADGTAKIPDPLEMWGLRQQIDRMTSKRSQAEDSNLHYAAGQLGKVSDVMDQQIEKVAPGYDDMIANYANHSRKMDEMKVLQDAEPGLLRGPGQSMTFNDMQRFMRQVVKARNTPTTDVNPYKSITPETMERLWNLRDDLRRSSSAMDLAKASGSDTAPNFMDVAKQYMKLGGTAGVHAVANYLSPGFGSMAVSGTMAALRPIQAARLSARQQARGHELLYPPNPLTPSNQPP